MKKRIFALALTAALLCSGCSSLLDRSYVSSATHIDYVVTEDESILRVENYPGLVNALLHFVTEHSYTGTIRLYNYTGDVEKDLQAACEEVLHEDPLGAYAVRYINYTSTRILTYYEVDVTITYSRSRDEVKAILPVSGQSGLRQELDRICGQYLTKRTLRTSFFSGNAQQVNSLFWLAYYNNPSASLAAPKLHVTFYPTSGPHRILEISVSWLKLPSEMAAYDKDLTSAAFQLLEAHPAAGEEYTIEELASMLRSVLVYDPSGAGDALSALQGRPVNDQGSLLALEQLCLQTGLEVTAATDDDGAQLWLIVSTPSGYRHLLPRGLRPVSDPGGPPWKLPLYTDEELSAMGFRWHIGLYPSCVDYSGAVHE